MTDKDRNPLGGEAMSRYLLEREAVRVAAAAMSRGSPVALESTLSDISAEVTAEAIERRQREAAAK